MNYEDFIKEKDKFNCNCKYLPIKEYIFNENCFGQYTNIMFHFLVIFHPTCDSMNPYYKT